MSGNGRSAQDDADGDHQTDDQVALPRLEGEADNSVDVGFSAFSFGLVT